MKQLLALALAAALPVSGICSSNINSAYSGGTNMTTSYADAITGSTDADNPNRATKEETGNLILAEVPAETDNAPTNGDQAPAAWDDDDDLSFLDDDEEILDVWDPIEPFNRGMFWFNDKLYFYLLKPVARGWRWLIPHPGQVALSNVFSNLATPVRMINAGLQGKFGDAGNELNRFAINTTIGIGGMFDAAKAHFDIKKKNEDTGQTLGFYGVGPGPYLVLPFFGPSNARDGIGLLADSRMDLVYYLWEDQDYWTAIVLDVINKTALDKDTYEGIKKDALDPYLFVRDAFAQYRQNLIEN
jgi:phospholipid-binding lipoprotein MlaA